MDLCCMGNTAPEKDARMPAETEQVAMAAKDKITVTNVKPVGSCSKRLGRRNSESVDGNITWKPTVYSHVNNVDSIQIVNVDYHIQSNTHAHHTDEYDVTKPRNNDVKGTLVVRRGQAFDVSLQCHRHYNVNRDRLMVHFRFGSNPKPTNKTHVQVALSEKLARNQWGVALTSISGSDVIIRIMTPASCQVGRWKIEIDVLDPISTGLRPIGRFQLSNPVYILFNPWCEDDDVYMKGAHLLNEYVLNQTGRIYSGNFRNISERPWAFGQFSGNVLNCCLYILDKAGIKDHARGDPVIVTRRISALVNSNDEGGIVVGNWSGDYRGGKSPLAWTGSAAILEKYFRTRAPVKFGQCWTFSGITTTVCRALGIPARCVTNFRSAHDTDGSITIDNHFDSRGRPIYQLDSDSVWNFHVWNDVWMARPDLPSEYSGWQAIDSTPQETSNGIFCMGPMPLAAIKKGELELPYDGPFVFAEVNADRVLWRVNDDGTAEAIKIIKNSIGKNISTKLPFQDAREDITHQYKYPEGSDEERTAVRRANLLSTLNAKIYHTGPQDFQCDLEAEPSTPIGGDVVVHLNLTNNSEAIRTVTGTVVIATSYYTGVHFRNVAHVAISGEILQPRQAKTLVVNVEAKAYLAYLADHCMLKVTAIVRVSETGQQFGEVEEIELALPNLEIKAPLEATSGRPFPVTVSFVNPLPIPLTDGELMIESPGMVKTTVLSQRDIQPNAPFSATFNMVPSKPGKREIIVVYTSRQLSSIRGHHVIGINQ